jgi:hypothetical protein
MLKRDRHGYVLGVVLESTFLFNFSTSVANFQFVNWVLDRTLADWL